MSETVIHTIATVSEFDEFVAAGKTPAVVKFSATWCGPCVRVEPEFVRMAKKYGSQMRFARVDFDSAEEIVRKQGVTQIPSFHYWKGGARIGTVTDSRITRVEKALLLTLADDSAAKKS